MERNDPCWRGSGKKWKKCHRDREKLPPRPIWETLALLRGEFSKGYCSHPDASASACGNKIIRAHTVQRRGGLEAIAETGHVISFKAAYENIHRNKGVLIPQKVGWRDASTFFGFCDDHDSTMFRPVEASASKATLTDENCFLLSFRALAYELFTKRAAKRGMPAQRLADCGRSFDIQVQIQRHMHVYEHGLDLGLADLERWKRKYDSSFKSKSYSDCKFVGVEFSGVLPIVGCGGFMPEFDFSGARLQNLVVVGHPLQEVTYNLTVMNGVSVAVLGWIDSADGPAASFVNSFRALPDEEKSWLAVQLAFEHLENIYVRPTWWESLDEDAKAAAIARCRAGTGEFGYERKSDCLSLKQDWYCRQLSVTSVVSN